MKQMAQAFFGILADLHHSVSIFRIKGIENHVLRCFGGRLTISLWRQVLNVTVLKTHTHSVRRVTEQADYGQDRPFVSSPLGLLVVCQIIES